MIDLHHIIRSGVCKNFCNLFRICNRYLASAVILKILPLAFSKLCICRCQLILRNLAALILKHDFFCIFRCHLAADLGTTLFQNRDRLLEGRINRVIIKLVKCVIIAAIFTNHINHRLHLICLKLNLRDRHLLPAHIRRQSHQLFLVCSKKRRLRLLIRKLHMAAVLFLFVIDACGIVCL